jgi:hypothetical protein
MFVLWSKTLGRIDFIWNRVSTGGPRYSRTFYLRIRVFTFEKLVQIDTFQVKNGLFIYEFKIRGPKWWNVTTANNEGNLYICIVELGQWDSELLEYVFPTLKNIVEKLLSRRKKNSHVLWASNIGFCSRRIFFNLEQNYFELLLENYLRKKAGFSSMTLNFETRC